MLNICFDDVVGGHLLISWGLADSEGILPLNLHLDRGRLRGDVIATQERMSAEILGYHFPNMDPREIDREYKKGLRKARRCYKDLEERIKAGQAVRVWIDNTAHDRCGLYWLCDIARPYQPKIFVASCPGYGYDAQKDGFIENRNWATFTDHDFPDGCAQKAVRLAQIQIDRYAQAWKRAVEQDTALRVLINDHLVSVDEDLFDAALLRHIDRTPKTQASIMEQFCLEYRGLDLDLVMWRIDHLLKSDVIKVCEEKVDSHGCCWPRTISRT